MKLNVPKNTSAKVLYVLIKNRSASIKDFPYLAGFRTRISELTLKHNVNLFHISKSDVNSFGRNYQYKVHFLPTDEVKNAIKVYKKINI